MSLVNRKGIEAVRDNSSNPFPNSKEKPLGPKFWLAELTAIPSQTGSRMLPYLKFLIHHSLRIYAKLQKHS